MHVPVFGVYFQEELVKKIFLISFACMLMACTPLVPAASSPALTTSRSVLVVSTSLPKDRLAPVPTWMNLIPATPTATSVPPPTAERQIALPQPTPAGPTCLQLIAPTDGITFLKRKPVRFLWYAKRGAQAYVLLLTHQDGFQEKIIVNGTELLLNRRARPDDLTYQWNMSAYDANNQVICTSPTRTFTLYSAPAAAAASPTAAPATGGQVASRKGS
jgi:hypothetical protein